VVMSTVGRLVFALLPRGQPPMFSLGCSVTPFAYPAPKSVEG
jgi:hypothetical protein